MNQPATIIVTVTCGISVGPTCVTKGSLVIMTDRILFFRAWSDGDQDTWRLNNDCQPKSILYLTEGFEGHGICIDESITELRLKLDQKL